MSIKSFTKTWAISIVLFVLVNVVFSQLQPSLLTQATRNLGYLSMQVSLIGESQDVMTASDKQIYEVLRAEFLQESLDFSEANSDLPLHAYIKFYLNKESILDTRLLADYLSCQYGLTCNLKSKH